MTKKIVLGLALAGAMLPLAAHAAGDAENGAKVYKRCAACHVVDKEMNRVGPHLVGLFGREAGSVEGYRYSDAMKESGVTWDEETIDKYVENPKSFIPKNKMSFPGLKKEEDRQDLIAYLKEATKS
ncbi:cytochrome c family protein [Geminicoccaceae bacterium 1502E]|nr:cytochrome c family protein [Geminicoccaceae bacterium 1502E]